MGQKVLLFNSRLHLFPRKLKSRWSESFVVKEVFSHGVVELSNEDDTNAFKVIGQRVKPYYGGDIDRIKVSIDLERSHEENLMVPTSITLTFSRDRSLLLSFYF